MKAIKYLLTIVCTLTLTFAYSQTVRQEKRILIFTKNQTGGYIHECIPASITGITKIALENGIVVDTTTNSAFFTDDNLKKYSALVFSSTNNKLFETENERIALQRYIQAGGGFVGVHSATGSEREWAWFAQMIGGTFWYHPPFQEGAVIVKDKTHISTKDLPKRWVRSDEFYFVRNINADIKVLAVHDCKSLKNLDKRELPTLFGTEFPSIWCHEFDGGRQWYTAYGHSPSDYADPVFMKHILGGILYAIGNNYELDYSKTKIQY